MNGPDGDSRSASPWRSAPLLWFVVGLPLTVVVAAFVTLGIAIRQSDDVVRDDFRKEGLAIYADPGRDAAAAALGASASISVDPGSGRIRILLTLQRGEPPRSLLAVLSHATRAEYDRVLTLDGGAGAYQGATGELQPGRWYVEITPPDRRWRLRGDFRDAVSGLRLTAPGVS